MSTRGGGTRPGTGSGGRATSANRAGAAAARRARTPEERDAIQARWEARRAIRDLEQVSEESSQRQQELRAAQTELALAHRQAQVAARQEILAEGNTRQRAQAARLDTLRQRQREAEAAERAANDEAHALAQRVTTLREQLQSQHVRLRDSEAYQEAFREGRAAERRSQRASMNAYSAQVNVRNAEQRMIDSRSTDYNNRIASHPVMVTAQQRHDEARARAADADQRLLQARQRYRDAADRADRAQYTLEASRAGNGPIIKYGYSPQVVRETKSAIRATFGRTLSRNDLAKLTGAKRGDRINLSPLGNHGISVEISGANHEGSFSVYKRNGEIIIGNTYVRNTGEKTGASGRNVIGSFQDIASLGVNKLEASAARGPTYNGYYTWAKLGFTGDIPPNRLGAAQRAFGSNVTRVEQLMATAAGRHWWKQNGDSWHATFDFTPGSHSMREMAKLTRNRGGS